MTKETKYLLVVGGPTASGKTSLAIELAQHFDTEIISADSRQFYQEMEIGTARPSATELAAVKHHFIADRSIHQPLNAGQFAEEALVILAQVFEKRNYAVLVGGSGLFIKALCEGLDTFPKVSTEIRTEVDSLVKIGGLAALQEALSIHDPAYYAVVDQQNPSRLQRALEVCLTGDQPYSYYLGKNAEKRAFVPVYFQPAWPRETLYTRIDQRVDLMVAEGLEKEARHLLPQQQLSALQTVGYQEWFTHFSGEIDRESTIALIKQNTRRYAKRQLTWNRRDGYWKTVPKGDIRSVLTYLNLVQKEGWSLCNVDFQQIKHTFFTKERTIGIGLKNQEETIVGEIRLISVKDWAWLKSYELKDLSDAAKIVLLHEALQRAEVPVVYAQPNSDSISLFEQVGFNAIEQSRVPDKLAAKITAKPVWRWERED